MNNSNPPTILRTFLVLLFVLTVATSSSPAAYAVPGETFVDGPQLKVKNAKKQIDGHSAESLGRVITRLDDGSYLAFGDTSKVKRLSKNTVLFYEQRVLRVRHFSRRGKLDRRFDKSPIGRGVTLGSANEVWDFIQIVKQSPGVYVAWGKHKDLATGTPSMKAIAFDPRTGRLVRSFGINGVQRLGRRRGLTEGGFMLTNAMQPLADGRIMSCGEMRIPKLFTVDSRSRALLNVTDLTQRSPRPFLADGNRAFGAGETPEDGAFRDCRAIAQTASGRVVVAGEQGIDYYLNRPRPWLAAFDPSGAPDLTFGTGGITVLPETVTSSAGGNLLVRALIASRVGGVYVAGRVHNGTNRGFVARIDANGNVDPSFGTGGLVVIPKFTVDDISEGEDGSLLLTGATGGDGGAPAAGRLTASGTWDPNFYGAGHRVYPKSYTFHFFQLFSGPTAYLWESTDGDMRAVLRIENHVTLDSSITSARRTKSGNVVVHGVASDSTGVSSVDVAVARKGEQPTNWIRAAGTNLWSVDVPNPGRSKEMIVYSRATGADGATEDRFSASDRNRLRLK